MMVDTKSVYHHFLCYTKEKKMMIIMGMRMPRAILSHAKNQHYNQQIQSLLKELE